MSFTKPSLPICSSSNNTSSSPNLRTKSITFCVIFVVSFSFIFFLTDTFPRTQVINVIRLRSESMITSFHDPPNKVKPPRWLEVIRQAREAQPLRVGLVNFEDTSAEFFSSHPLNGIFDSVVTVDLEYIRVTNNNLTWMELFPEWIDEDIPSCPSIPMPSPGKYPGLDVIVAQLPCKDSSDGQFETEDNKNGTKGIRDIQRLQISLATARLVAENKDVYTVFVGKCEPMLEIFRCEDLVWHEEEYWVYKPNVEKLREVISMPVGTCALAQGSLQMQTNPNELKRPRHAYVTVLHSSEDYVCGAIALARTIRQTNSTKDLVILVDPSISKRSIVGLEAAGWKVMHIERIRSPHAKPGVYNEWNYSKLRVWQLTEYQKVIFIDSDFIVLCNIDHLFDFPQLSASPNNKWFFNSGIMVLEPSQCFFNTLMSRRYTVQSYNGGDQGYLNEVLTWWHRLPASLNFLKHFPDEDVNDRPVPEDQYTIHFLGLKPWKCYRDYDCNWDSKYYREFASDDVHERWWRVYDAMPVELQAHCGMSQDMDKTIRKRREMAKQGKVSDGHWKIEIKDPRQFKLVGSN